MRMMHFDDHHRSSSPHLRLHDDDDCRLHHCHANCRGKRASCSASEAFGIQRLPLIPATAALEQQSSRQ